MTLSITSTQVSIVFMDQRNTTNRPLHESTDAKKDFIVNPNHRAERIVNHVNDVYERVDTGLDAVEQFAEDNGYSKLITYANKVVDNVHATEPRFNVAGRLQEQHAEGDYAISEEQAGSMIDKIEQVTEARMAAVNEKLDTLSDHFDEIEQKVIDNGFEGDRINVRRDKMEEHMESRLERIELHSEKAKERIQSRLDESYNILSEAESTDELTTEPTDVQA